MNKNNNNTHNLTPVAGFNTYYPTQLFPTHPVRYEETLLNEIVEMKTEHEKMVLRVKTLEEENKQIKYVLDNYVHLSDAEASEVNIGIKDSSTAIAKVLFSKGYYKTSDDFGEKVGAIRKGLHSMLRSKFNVNSYKKIPHKDFESAQYIAKSFTVRDYVQYKNIRGFNFN